MPSNSEVGAGASSFSAGAARSARKLWQDYFAEIDGVVFLVDALDHNRFQEAKAELDVSLAAETSTVRNSDPCHA